MKCIDCETEIPITAKLFASPLKPIVCCSCNAMMKHSRATNLLLFAVTLLGASFFFASIALDEVMIGALGLIWALLITSAISLKADVEPWPFTDNESS